MVGNGMPVQHQPFAMQPAGVVQYAPAPAPAPAPVAAPAAAPAQPQNPPPKKGVDAQKVLRVANTAADAAGLAVKVARIAAFF